MNKKLLIASGVVAIGGALYLYSRKKSEIVKEPEESPTQEEPEVKTPEDVIKEVKFVSPDETKTGYLEDGTLYVPEDLPKANEDFYQPFEGFIPDKPTIALPSPDFFKPEKKILNYSWGYLECVDAYVKPRIIGDMGSGVVTFKIKAFSRKVECARYDDEGYCYVPELKKWISPVLYHVEGIRRAFDYNLMLDRDYEGVAFSGNYETYGRKWFDAGKEQIITIEKSFRNLGLTQGMHEYRLFIEDKLIGIARFMVV